jgi:hypothetical protein
MFPQLNIKLKGHHFDTINVIEAESQAVLNTFTEQDFQDAFKKMVEELEMVHTCGRALLQGRWWPVGPKLVFDQMAAPVPEIMDGSLYAVKIYCLIQNWTFVNCNIIMYFISIA